MPSSFQEHIKGNVIEIKKANIIDNVLFVAKYLLNDLFLTNIESRVSSK
jgi:hypothetical protein